jgi:hypothetical protein
MSVQPRARSAVISGMDVDPHGGPKMPNMTAEDLAEHLELLAASSEEDRDQLLHDLLVQAYPTKHTQDS